MVPPRSKRRPSGSGEKERFEVLLEANENKLNLVLEGQDQLRQEVGSAFKELRDELEQRFSVLEQGIREIAGRVKAHEEMHTR